MKLKKAGSITLNRKLKIFDWKRAEVARKKSKVDARGTKQNVKWLQHNPRLRFYLLQINHPQ